MSSTDARAALAAETIVPARPRAEQAHELIRFFDLRPNRTCDSGWLDTFIWSDYYQIQYFILDGKALVLLFFEDGEPFASMPWCAEADLPMAFAATEQYFNRVLHRPLKVALADEPAVRLLGLDRDPRYLLREETDLRDYIYDAECLRTLSGKLYQKKKNHLNRFRRDFDGRWVYRDLRSAGAAELRDFLDRWFAARTEETPHEAETLDYEKRGILEILDERCLLPYRIGGIDVDGRLAALSIGSFNARENMAVISVEKADSAYPGLYQLINQQFLLHAFPRAGLVNREDDMGLPGLRLAKESYHPVGYARKFLVLQKDAGAESGGD
ncbi:MAG: DUF2156 domain-containing protein [Oscillospiraceae bacterium]|jgi:hypothetical protein|nr:DUF2156 domain-containing protein [Oscillospiraceae bacterium]